MIDMAFCDRDRIRTCDRLLRRQMLYPAELRDPSRINCVDPDLALPNEVYLNFLKKASFLLKLFSTSLSGWQDSNLRPPRPKRGAITGLRYTPKLVIFLRRDRDSNPGNTYALTD